MTSGNTIHPESVRLGWIGTGVMGQSMCAHLLRAGYSVTASTRTPSKAKPLLELGAQWADTPRDVAAQSDVVFAIVGYPADVREVFLGTEGALAGARDGTIFVDMTTSQPRLAEEIAAAAQQRGVQSLDAPVSGGDVGARKGTLSIMVGGPREAFDWLEPCWSLLGSKWVWQGPAGAGQHAKMVNQTLIASNMI
ncbi:MAG: NAD(P)-dependent oxidoreductase, partial [Planctomycetales bacterium]|nr:NAD(P)-dependent oxidoreductase [Planctomycetales bacterium]